MTTPPERRDANNGQEGPLFNKAVTDAATEAAKASRDRFAELATGSGTGITATRAEPIMRYFAYEHLPAHLQVVSKPFGDLALLICDKLPASAERAAGLRKLLEAKDCAVRAALT